MRRTPKDQGDLFGYVSPEGEPLLHPPLCICGLCRAPVERFPQPAVALIEQIPAEEKGEPCN